MLNRMRFQTSNDGTKQNLLRLLIDVSILALLLTSTLFQTRALHTATSTSTCISTIALFFPTLAANAQFSLFALQDSERDPSRRGLIPRLSSGELTLLEAGIELASLLQIIGLWVSIWVVFCAALLSPGTTLTYADAIALTVAMAHMAIVCIGGAVAVDPQAERTERRELIASVIAAMNHGAVPLCLILFFFAQGAALVGRDEGSSSGMSPAAFGLLALAFAGMAGRWQQRLESPERKSSSEEEGRKWVWQRWEFLPLSFAFEAFAYAGLGVLAAL